MNDLLEDQKIHYIVKDYRRMFNEYWGLVDGLKECKALLEKRDNRIKDLERQVENLQKKIEETPSPMPVQAPTPKEIKGLVKDIQAQVEGTIRKLEKRITTLNRTTEEIRQLKEFLKV